MLNDQMSALERFLWYHDSYTKLAENCKGVWFSHGAYTSSFVQKSTLASERVLSHNV